MTSIKFVFLNAIYIQRLSCYLLPYGCAFKLHIPGELNGAKMNNSKQRHLFVSCIILPSTLQ